MSLLLLCTAFKTKTAQTEKTDVEADGKAKRSSDREEVGADGGSHRDECKTITLHTQRQQ